MSTQAAINLAYLVASLLFVFGLKRLAKPATARGGNQMAALGMLIAIVVTLFDKQILSPTFIIVGLAVGSAIGAALALRVQMTAMPQLVGFFNGMGGAASAFVAWSHFDQVHHAGEVVRGDVLVTMVLSIAVGMLTLTGSLIACAKLMEGKAFRAFRGAVSFPGQQLVNALLAAGTVAVMVLFCLDPQPGWALYAMLGAGSLLGVLLVIPIGGADMPVVIAFLNAMSGLAAALTGFVLGNMMLIIVGSMVGASGLILTNIMCRAMNRTLGNVLFSAFGAQGATSGSAARRSKDDVPHRSPDDVAIVLENAGSVIVVPGYGLAVARAQHVLRELCDLLEANGTTVKYAIHPVAGRMPGHMNVLLAEADVSYEKMYAMEDINAAFAHCDVCLIVGANDVTNPVARTDATSPLYRMPILDCDQARTVIVMKRSLSPGYAGVDNPLFYMDKTMMLFGDARASSQAIVQILKG